MNAIGGFNTRRSRGRIGFFTAMAVLWGGLLVASADAAEPWPLGKLILNTEKPESIPEGYEISGFSVSCPGVEKPLQGFLAVAPHRGSARGLVMLFTGGDGTSWWTGKDPQTHKLAEELRTDGFTIVQVRWSGCWHHSSPGNDAGTAHLACRPATVIKHVHEKLYLPLGIKPAKPGQAGFCITGNSGGATQVSYALSHYGLDGILDVVIPTGGPPHSVLAKSMLEPDSGRQGYGYPESTRAYIDKSFGYFEKNGPGKRQDADFKPRWEQESVATGGNDYQHPSTRIHFIFGDRDKGMQTVAKDYYDRLIKEGSPMVKWELALDTNHGIAQTAAGRAALKAAILGIANPAAPAGKEAVPPTSAGKTIPAVAPDKPDARADPDAIDVERARTLYQKSQRGEKLTPDEQAYLDKARRQRQKPKGKEAGHR